MRNALVKSLLLSAACVGASPAFAQEEGTSSDGLGEIIVTAQKRAENIQDVPIAISAVGSEYLESRGISSIDSLGTIAPNVKIERAPSSKTITQIAIRGSVTINPAITWEPAVGLYLDGVYIAKAQGSIFDIADLERVEVLRGPQGTLYGRNALAGAINLITKKPSGEAGGSMELTYGSYDYKKIKGVIDLPRMGIFSAKLSGQYVKRDGLVDIVPNPVAGVVTALPNVVNQTDTIDSGSFMAQVRAELSDSVALDYTYDYNKQKQRPPFAQLLRVNRTRRPPRHFRSGLAELCIGGAFFPLHLYANPKRQGVASIDGGVYERSRAYGHALTLTADLGSATLKSITAYRDLAWSDGLDLDGSPTPVAYTQRITDYHALSQELQLTGTALSDRLNYVLGAFYFKEKAETLGPQVFFGGGADFQSDYGSHTRAFALYTQLDYKLTDALKLSVGGRYTHEAKDVRRFLRVNFDAANGIFSPLVVANIPYGGVPDAKYNNFSPAATLSYAASEDVNVYARFARGFKSGGFNGETNDFGAPTAACPTGALELCDPYNPEKVDSYELGIKTKLADGRLILNVAAFRDQHKDIQLSIFRATGAASSIVRNAASARIQGLEFEAIARPVDALTVNATLALLDAKYNKYLDAGLDVSNNRAFPHTPKRSASLGVDWAVFKGDWGKFNLYGDVNYVSAYFTFPYPLVTPTPSDQNAYTTRSKGRTIVNLRAALSDFEIGGVKTEIAAFVRNLTKEDNPSNFIDFGPGFGGLTLGYFPDPRTWGISAAVRF
ncbi:MAG: TonB-dependent receptor [Sphingomonadales bacterium]|nr:TonB-dependent receptor [Sphingomonadales bacterium]